MGYESGQVVAGKYRLSRLLGQGGMASVWAATNVFTERQCAVKFLLESVSKSPEASRRFLMEGKISGRVQHPNVIDVMDVGQTENGALFIVMELLNGVSLETAIRRQNPPMSVYEFVGIMLDVARALLAAHRGGVVHRDLKPSNIYLHKDREGIAVPKVLDFGVSKFFTDDDRDQSLTIAGTVLGSPLYMSPEQAMGAIDVDHRTDVFAFGAILFEALCGFRCFDAPNFNALIVAIATQQPKRIDDYAPHLPEILRAVARDCLVTERTVRIQNMEVVIERLAAVLPTLESSILRLPTPINGPGPQTDPEATSAMPAVVRPSDRPPPMDTSAHSPATGFAAPPTSNRQHAPPIMMFVGAGVIFASMLVVIVILVVVARNRQAPKVIASPSPTAAASTSPTATFELGSDTPVISVDSLPSAATSKPATVQKGTGKLWISAAPGWCNVTVDGKAQGATPVTDIDLPSGSHSVKCVSASGKTESIAVQIYASGTTKHKFNVDP